MSNRSIQRLRTFQDDFDRAREEAGIKNGQAPGENTTTKWSTSDSPIPSVPKSDNSRYRDKPLPAPNPEFLNTKPRVAEEPYQPKIKKENDKLPKTVVAKPIPETPSTTEQPNPPVEKIYNLSTPSIKENKPVEPKKTPSLQGLVMEDIDSTVFNNARTSVQDIGDGDIITDTKRTRFRLIPAIIKSLKNWFAKTEEEWKKSKQSTPKVSPAEKRSNIIATAAKQSSLAPNDDYQQVAKRLSGVKRSTETADLSIRDSEEIEPAHWAYVEETEEAGGREPEPTLVIPKPVAQETELEPEEVEQEEVSTDSTEVLEDTNQTQESATESATVWPETLPKDDVPEPVNTSEVEMLTEPVAIEKQPLEPTDLPADNTPTTEVEVENTQPTETQLPAPDANTPPQKRLYRPSPRPHRSFAPVITVVVIIVATGLGVASTFWLFGKQEETVTIKSQGIYALIQANEQLPVSLTNNSQAFMQNIMTAEPKALSEIAITYPTMNVQGSTEIAETSEILSVLSWQMPMSLRRNIEDINFGLWRGEDPFIILKTESFDIALSGMLNWEKNISQDLAPLFGTPVTRTFDPNSREASQTKPAYFIDSVLDNLDVRILRDELYKDRIVYSFIDKNTILITKSTDSFRALTPYIK